MKFARWLIVAILIIFVAGFFKMRNGTSKDAKTKAADFSLEDLEGNELSLEGAESNVILFFWATWCPHCRNKIPKLNKAYSDMQSNDIEVWAIDVGESKAKVKSYINKHPVSFPMLLDTDSSVSTKYKVLGVPTFVFVDEDKNILSRGHDLPGDYLEIFSDK